MLFEEQLMSAMSSAVFMSLFLGVAVLAAWWWAWWRKRQLLAQVTLVVLPDFQSQYLGNHRSLYVYLPPQYVDSPEEFYPVLYVNDGQDREQLQLHETLARLFSAGKICPVIVVAIPTNEDRLQEYGTMIAGNAQGLGRKAEAYGRFVVEEVMPAIHTQFRTQTDPAQTGMLGASLGGLSAFDIVWNYPAYFGVVGVFSGSFWWRAGEDEVKVAPNQLIAHEMVRQGRYRVPFRAWFEAATRDELDDRDGNGVIDAIQDTRELIEELVGLGYEEGRDVVYYEVLGGRHHYGTWAKVLPDFLVWVFPSAKG